MVWLALDTERSRCTLLIFIGVVMLLAVALAGSMIVLAVETVGETAVVGHCTVASTTCVGTG